VEPLPRRALAARRDDAARMAGDPIRHRLAARRLVAGDAEGAADRAKNLVARAHRCAVRLAFHWAWKVAPWGAGNSRWRVQPAASGSHPNRPLRRPISASARANRPVAMP